MKLLDIYRSVLKFVGLEADENGYINTMLDDKKEPACINGLRMVLPVNEQLRGFRPDEKIIFHPLTENILRGESEVFKKIKQCINIKLNFSIGIVAQNLLSLVASPEFHNKLSPEQAELLTSITDADEKSVTNFISQMVKGVKANPDRLFTNIFLKRGGKVRHERFSRVGVVSFPFYQQLIDDKIEGIRVKDKQTFKELFEFIFTEIKDADDYNFGSNSHVAPYLESLLRTAANIASRLNDIIELYKDHIEDADKLLFDSDWLEHFENLDDLIPEIRKIPVQAGNDGSISTEDVVAAPVAQPQPQQPQQYTPATQYAPQAPVAPQYQQPAQYQPPQMMQPMQPEVKVTSRGIDFKSLVQATPSLAYLPNPIANQMQMNQMQQRQMQEAQRIPSWAGDPRMMQQYPQQPMMQPMQYPQQPMMQPMQYPQQPMMQPMQYPQQPMFYPNQPPPPSWG